MTAHVRDRRIRQGHTENRITDQWNPRKVWVIRAYADGHYAFNQEIGGRMFYTAFQRTTKRYIDSIIAVAG